MPVNDFLSPLFSLEPYVVASIVLLWGFGSLLLIAIRTNSMQTLIRNPAIMIGDLFLLPLIVFSITYFYQNTSGYAFPSALYYATALVALILTIISAKRFDLINIWWGPHEIFYWFMAYIVITFLVTGIVMFMFGVQSLLLLTLWAVVAAAIILHQLLGIIFSKQFPKRKTL